MTNRRILLISLVFALIMPLGAQNNGNYSQIRLPGDKIFHLEAGAIFPLFNMDLSGNVISPGLTPGYFGDIGIDVYVTRDWLLGGEVGFSTVFSVNTNPLISLPLTARALYVFSFGDFDVPTGVEVGVDFTWYMALFGVDMMIKPRSGLYYNFNSQYSLGIDLGYRLIPQLYLFGNIPVSDSRFGNMFDLCLSGRIHF